MPLSEDEQRILDEIEQNFQRDDPRLAKEVGETTVYRYALGSLRRSIAGFIVGLIIMVAALQVSYFISFFGFLLMWYCALIFERNLRTMGRAGFSQVSNVFRAARAGTDTETGDGAEQDQ